MGRAYSCWMLNWWCITWPVGFKRLTLILLTWRIWWASNNVSGWQMGFNLAFRWLMAEKGSWRSYKQDKFDTFRNSRKEWNDVIKPYTWPTCRHHPNRTHDLRSGSQDHHPSTNWVQKTICCNSTSNAPDDGCMRPKHVELRKLQ